LTAYAVVIFIGSVHLGWHYAIDGYAGIAGTWLIWKFAGFVLGPRAPSPGQERVVASDRT
jgi:hypothetical protein